MASELKPEELARIAGAVFEIMDVDDREEAAESTFDARIRRHVVHAAKIVGWDWLSTKDFEAVLTRLKYLSRIDLYDADWPDKPIAPTDETPPPATSAEWSSL